MEYRRKISGKIYKYLEDRINCANILEQLDLTDKKQITIDLIPVVVDVLKYTDDDKNDDKKILSKKELDGYYDRFEYISTANHTGFEYFPYLYGILNCSDTKQVYVLYETFDGTLDELFKILEQGSDWYETIFQVILIHYYMTSINKISYSCNIKNHLYQKYKFPKKRQYTLGEYKFDLYHKNLIVLWDFTLESNSNESNSNNESKSDMRFIDLFIDFFNKNKDEFKVQPSMRIIKMLNDIKHINNSEIPKILDNYYNSKKEPSKELSKEQN